MQRTYNRNRIARGSGSKGLNAYIQWFPPQLSEGISTSVSIDTLDYRERVLENDSDSISASVSIDTFTYV